MATDERLLVTSLEGELILVDAKADKLKILGRTKVFKDDRGVYSHPALVGTRLYLLHQPERDLVGDLREDARQLRRGVRPEVVIVGAG